MAQQRSENDINLFKQIIWDYYKAFGRIFDWRQTTNPYHIFVSEIMLQQTQTHRVSKKYSNFILQFPDFGTLASSSVKDIIIAWSGLGYNRRALYLHQSARKVCDEYAGMLPNDPNILVTFPGIGNATSSSICAFAFNMPTIFIETNIRAVFIHFFFQGKSDISDAQILPLVEQSVDTTNARHWYYALMDYGVMLKQQLPNPSRKSIHHNVQSKFEGSDRQIRGKILKLLMQHQSIEKNILIKLMNNESQRTEKILNDLCVEGFILSMDGTYKLKE